MHYLLWIAGATSLDATSGAQTEITFLLMDIGAHIMNECTG